MPENEPIEAQNVEEIPPAELAEGELESVSGGTAWLLVGGPLIITSIPTPTEGSGS